MNDLILNPKTLKIARNQYRCIQYLKMLGELNDCEIEVQPDNYIAPVLINSDILAVINKKLIREVTPCESQPIFELFDCEVSQERINYFIQQILAISEGVRAVDSSISPVNMTVYGDFVTWLSSSLEAFQNIDGFPVFDFNSDAIIYDYKPSEAEIKLMINIYGVDCINVYDNNADLDKEPSAFSNNLWALYIMQITCVCALQLIALNIPFYTTFIGGTSLQVTLMQMYFNLTQLVFCPLWHWLSDYVGRKPIMIGVFLWSIVTTMLMTFAVQLDNKVALSYLMGIRALSGLSAIIQPMGYTIASDLAPPKKRAMVVVITNCCGQFGAILCNAINLILSKGAKYQTKNISVNDPEYLVRTKLSFQHGLYIAVGIYVATTLFAIFLLKESHSRVVAARQLKKLGIKAEMKSAQVQKWGEVFKWMVSQPSLVMMFFSFICSLIGAVNSRNLVNIFVQKAYGFATINEAKAFSNTTQIVSIFFGIALALVGTKFILKHVGEVKIIITC